MPQGPTNEGRRRKQSDASSASPCTDGIPYCPDCACQAYREPITSGFYCGNTNCPRYARREWITPPAPPSLRAVTRTAALSRRSDPSTSAEAAEYMTEGGRLGEAQRRALEAVKAHPDSTANEISVAVGDGADARKIGRRLPELEKRRLVYRSGTRACRITNRNATTWRARG